jgi:hypothetical protein
MTSEINSEIYWPLNGSAKSFSHVQSMLLSKVQDAQIIGPIEPLWINLEIVYSLHEIKIQFQTSGGNIYAHICVWNWTFLRLVAQWNESNIEVSCINKCQEILEATFFGFNFPKNLKK